MNKNSLLLALIAGTAPLIAQDKPSQVLESLMQPLPSVASNIQARETAFPALRQIPSSACAFVSIADVQGNITKLLNNKLILAASEGESTAGIAKLPPIESVAIAFEQGAEANIGALLKMSNNFNKHTSILNILSIWEKSSKNDYKASFASVVEALNSSVETTILEGINKDDINIPEMRIIVSMKPGSEALTAELKQQFDALLSKQGLPMPIFEQDGYTVISLPLAMAAAMIPDLPAGTMDAIVKSPHYLALKFEGNCISLIYSRDLKKISAPSSIEQSMLASDKLKLSDARLAQGIISSSFMNAKIIKMMSDQDPYSGYMTLMQTVFQSLSKQHTAQAPLFIAASLAAEQVSKKIKDLLKINAKQVKVGNYTDVIWSNDKLNYAASIDYSHSTWNYKASKVNALNQIDQAETISYISISPIDTKIFNCIKNSSLSPTSITKFIFDNIAFIQNATTIGKGIIETLNISANKKLQNVSTKIVQSSDKFLNASQALCDIYKGTEGSITIYADNKGNAAELCKTSCSANFSEGKAPRITIISAVSDKAKLDAGFKTLQGLCDKECKLEDKYIINDKFISLGNSAALNQSLQSSLSKTPSSKEFAGAIFYFNAKSIAPLLKDETIKEVFSVIPEIFYVVYPKDNKFFLRVTLK